LLKSGLNNLIYGPNFLLLILKIIDIDIKINEIKIIKSAKKKHIHNFDILLTHERSPKITNNPPKNIN